MKIVIYSTETNVADADGTETDCQMTLNDQRFTVAGPSGVCVRANKCPHGVF